MRLHGRSTHIVILVAMGRTAERPWSISYPRQRDLHGWVGGARGLPRGNIGLGRQGTPHGSHMIFSYLGGLLSCTAGFGRG